MNTFRPGDLVRNIEPTSRYYAEIGVRTGTFVRYWYDMPGGHLYTLRNACDVRYPDLAGPYGYSFVAQSADDLERVEEK